MLRLWIAPALLFSSLGFAAEGPKSACFESIKSAKCQRIVAKLIQNYSPNRGEAKLDEQQEQQLSDFQARALATRTGMNNTRYGATQSPQQDKSE